MVHWPLEGKSPDALELVRSGSLDLIVNIPKDSTAEELRNDYMIRRAAVDHGVPLITNLQLARRLAWALRRRTLGDLDVRSWAEY
jgi:carbamoyl-phosphate synthase large subunit